MNGDYLTEHIVFTLRSQHRWWTIGEVRKAVDAPYLDVRDELERLVADGRAGRQQIRPWFKPIYGM